MTTRLALEFAAGSLIAAALAHAAFAISAPEGAEAYYAWLTSCLDAIEKDLPLYTRSAEAAAKVYLADGAEIGAYGGDPFVRELYNRSGGMMQMRNFDAPFRRGEMPATPRKSVALVGLREDRMDDTVAKIVEFRKRECFVVVFGRAELLLRARKALPEGAAPDAWIDTHAAPLGGLLFAAGGNWIVPTDSAALSAASWAWVGEFVAALTRLGKMPPMYLGYAIEGAAAREAKYKGLKFHDALPCRLEAGSLSRQWLASLRASLKEIRNREMPAVRVAATMAAAAQAAKGKRWVYLQGHETLRLMGCPHDPKWFEPIHRDWNTLKRDAVLSPGDFVLCVGYDQIYDGEAWQNFASNARKSGARLAWSFTDYRNADDGAVPPGEPCINQHWPRGDAVAEVPNYDIRCLPTSGVIAEAVLWMVHAEMTRIPTAPK